MTLTPFRWGILGAGNIAKSFAKGLKELPDAKLVAVGSRGADKAAAFAKEFDAERSYGSYEALAADPNIDAIYVATPHPFHRAHAELCIAHGKAVLCEKPFTVTAPDAQAIIDQARAAKVFVMEAMWTRFLPVTQQVQKWIADGRIGEPRQVLGDFGFRCGWDPASRLLDKNLAGGALLDVGIYCLAYTRMIFGAPALRVQAAGHIGESGVDEQVGILATFPNGGLATLTAAVRTNTPHLMTICGTAGRITVPGFWHATEATCHSDGKDAEVFKPVAIGNGYQHEAAEVARCVRAGLLESPAIPHSETLEHARAMDDIRRQIGLTYPMDNAPTAKSSAAARS